MEKWDAGLGLWPLKSILSQRQMSPSSHLCLLSFVVLILPSRGQTPEKGTSSFVVDQTSVNAHDPDKISLEVQPTPTIPTWETKEDTTSQTASHTETQHLTGMDTTSPVTDPDTPRSEEGTPAFPEIGAPNSKKDRMSQEPDENSPFYYDDSTLRKRGLLVSAVLFITGIIILTSGKCRQLSQICLNRHK